MILLHLTANTGPAECCLAVQHALKALTREGARSGVKVKVLEERAGPVDGTLNSVLLGLKSKQEDAPARHLAEHWSGTLQWICESPYRPGHARKNWFINGTMQDALPGAIQLPQAPRRTFVGKSFLEAQPSGG